MENMQDMKNCNCIHHKVIPFLVVVFGVTFLMGFWEMINWDVVNIVWPVIIIVIGLMKLVERMEICKCCSGICTYC
ncbi:MAG: hypothetical protein AAB340_03605 [Patescibacteria group bacterium]